MKISLPKLKALLRYLGTYTDPRFLGKVKMMKLLYFVDFMHVKKYGAPVTFDTYINLEHGPIPSAIKNLIDTADDDIDNSVLADTIRISKSDGQDIHRITPTQKFSDKDMEFFSEGELEILSEVVKRFGDKNTKYIEDASHKEAPWQETDMFDEIPYTLAVKDKDCLVDEEEIALMMEVTEK